MADPPSVPTPAAAPPSVAASMPSPQQSTSAVEIGRRRSLSRSSQRSGLRSSIGGKVVVPIYSASAIATAAPPGPISESALSDSDAGSLEELGWRARIGSFTATREEIRDGKSLPRSSPRRRASCGPHSGCNGCGAASCSSTPRRPSRIWSESRAMEHVAATECMSAVTACSIR